MFFTKEGGGMGRSGDWAIEAEPEFESYEEFIEWTTCQEKEFLENGDLTEDITEE